MGRRRHHLHEGWVPGGVKCLFTPPSPFLKLTHKLQRSKGTLMPPRYCFSAHGSPQLSPARQADPARRNNIEVVELRSLGFTVDLHSVVNVASKCW